MGKTAKPVPKPEPVIPHHDGAERGVIGSVLLDPRRLDEVILVVKPEDFFHDGRASCYRRLVAMRLAGKPIDTTLLVAELKANGEWDDGDKRLVSATITAVELAECMHDVVVAAHARHYAEIVAEQSYRRRVIVAFRLLIAKAYDPAVSVAELRRLACDLLGRINGGEKNGGK